MPNPMRGIPSGHINPSQPIPPISIESQIQPSNRLLYRRLRGALITSAHKKRRNLNMSRTLAEVLIFITTAFEAGLLLAVS
jgi:hypothetical protein